MMSSEQNVTSQSPESFHRDLENARVLLEDSPWRDNPQKYRKTAEGILRRILTFDPRNETAKLLLAKAEQPVPVVERAQPAQPAQPAPATRPVMKVAPPSPMPPIAGPASTSIRTRPAPPTPVVAPAPPLRSREDLSFVVQKMQNDPKGKPARRPHWGLLSVAVIGAGAGLLLLLIHPTTSTSQYVPEAAIAAPAPVRVSEPVKAPAAVPVEEPAAVAEPAATEVAAAAPVAAHVTTPQPSIVVKSELPPVAPIQTGTLAVSSPTTVDIYMGDQLVGSAPTSLVLPAGNQTVEYRHQDMRKAVTYAIKANETTTTMVTFDVPLQINARPWAQVSIDGAQRRSLGQTPLSDVRVPIGTLLIFENPNFPGKSYRVTGKETEIRITFP
jgi:hypothetical protein